jgi:hypothetical protein
VRGNVAQNVIVGVQGKVASGNYTSDGNTFIGVEDHGLDANTANTMTWSFRNNIVQMNDDPDATNNFAVHTGANTTYTGRNNLYWGVVDGWRDNTAGTVTTLAAWMAAVDETDSLYAHPMLRDDFTLAPDSPARRAGIHIAGARALDDLPLPMHPDIGAWQDRSTPGRAHGGGF